MNASTVGSGNSPGGVGSDPGHRVLEEDLRTRNGVYDSAASVIWRLGVYEPVHAGRRFTNIGGRTVLNFIGELTKLSPGSCALEVGSGLGDTCRYLAELFGYRVLGVDMNEKQVREARRMAESAGMSDRLQFIQASIEDPSAIEAVRDLLPAEGADLTYTMDVLMLTADPGAVITRAGQLLRPQGWLALNEVTSGPAMSDSLRESLWQMDGMKSLLTPSEYAACVREAGLKEFRIIDRTPLALDCFGKMAAAFVQKREEIVAGAGPEHYRDWVSVTDMYLRYFGHGELMYTQMFARRL
jgi:sarcosine/dimethylglycine N-methyltransferase